jgi:hypothetical protein
MMGLAVAMPIIAVALAVLYAYLTRPRDHLHPGE